MFQIFAKYLTFASVGLQNAVQFQVILVFVHDNISKISPAGFNKYATEVVRPDENALINLILNIPEQNPLLDLVDIKFKL